MICENAIITQSRCEVTDFTSESFKRVHWYNVQIGLKPKTDLNGNEHETCFGVVRLLCWLLRESGMTKWHLTQTKWRHLRNTACRRFLSMLRVESKSCTYFQTRLTYQILYATTVKTIRRNDKEQFQLEEMTKNSYIWKYEKNEVVWHFVWHLSTNH